MGKWVDINLDRFREVFHRRREVPFNVLEVLAMAGVTLTGSVRLLDVGVSKQGVCVYPILGEASWRYDNARILVGDEFQQGLFGTYTIFGRPITLMSEGLKDAERMPKRMFFSREDYASLLRIYDQIRNQQL